MGRDEYQSSGFPESDQGEVGEVGKLGKLGEDDELDGAELLRDALSPPLALTPNRHPLRGYLGPSETGEGALHSAALTPFSPLRGRRAGDEGVLTATARLDADTSFPREEDPADEARANDDP